MLPVSGAAQFMASGASSGDQPGELGQRRVVQDRQAVGRLGAVGQEQVPQAGGARLRLEVLDDLRELVRAPRGGELPALGGVHRLGREAPSRP